MHIRYHSIFVKEKNEDVAKMSGKIYTKQRLSLEGRFEKEVYALSYAFSRSCDFLKQLYIIFVLRKQKVYPQKKKKQMRKKTWLAFLICKYSLVRDDV